LGLTISRELADMLQGRIEVDSELGQGATFSVTIPAVLERRSVPLMPELTRSGPGEPGRE
ncbi:MAG: ATP-binding protein, partial [Phycisphaeraceae bacterium]